MVYLIEVRFHGYAKKYTKNLIYDVARKFNVKGVTRKKAVPHITLFGPFQTREEKKLINEVISVGQQYDLIPFKIKGFDFFDNKKGKVIYLDIDPSEKLKSLRRELAYKLFKISSTKPFEKDPDFAFHATIAFKDIDHKFDKIWNYIKHKQEPNINQHLLRITILKNGLILYEYDLMQKKLLNRHQALNKLYYKKTIELLKQKTSDYNSDLDGSENILYKIKLFFKSLFRL